MKIAGRVEYNLYFNLLYGTVYILAVTGRLEARSEKLNTSSFKLRPSHMPDVSLTMRPFTFLSCISSPVNRDIKSIFLMWF